MDGWWMDERADGLDVERCVDASRTSERERERDDASSSSSSSFTRSVCVVCACLRSLFSISLLAAIVRNPDALRAHGPKMLLCISSSLRCRGRRRRLFFVLSMMIPLSSFVRGVAARRCTDRCRGRCASPAVVDTERAELRRSIGRLGRVLSVAVVRPAHACVRYADMVKVVSTRDPRTRSAEGPPGTSSRRKL
jgi:hypothetical protein